MIDGFKISRIRNSMNAMDIITKSVKNNNDKVIEKNLRNNLFHYNSGR